MRAPKAYCLSIAGHDPCDGAGLTSDVKTFQSIGVASLSVCTSITFQNDDSFDGVEWQSEKSILTQLNKLLGNYTIAAIKIGLIKNLDVLLAVLNTIDEYYQSECNKPFIVWDPILSASAGFVFHHDLDADKLQKVLQCIDLITPNLPEAEQLFPTIKWDENLEKIALPCAVLLKGGHGTGAESKDVLFDNNEKILFSAKRLDVKKHGTGCILSAAITAYVALGKSLMFAVQNAKDYLHKALIVLRSELESK